MMRVACQGRHEAVFATGKLQELRDRALGAARLGEDAAGALGHLIAADDHGLRVLFGQAAGLAEGVGQHQLFGIPPGTRRFFLERRRDPPEGKAQTLEKRPPIG